MIGRTGYFLETFQQDLRVSQYFQAKEKHKFWRTPVHFTKENGTNWFRKQTDESLFTCQALCWGPAGQT